MACWFLILLSFSSLVTSVNSSYVQLDFLTLVDDNDDECLAVAVVDLDLDRVGSNSLDGSAMDVG